MRKRKWQRCSWLVLVVLCLSGFDFAQHGTPLDDHIGERAVRVSYENQSITELS